MAIIAGKIAVATEPPRANSRRRPSLSAKYPEKSFTKLDTPSLKPSMIPRARTGAPRVIRNEGRRTVTDSYPRSPKKLARPAPTTVRFSHPGHFIPVYRAGIHYKGRGFTENENVIGKCKNIWSMHNDNQYWNNASPAPARSLRGQVPCAGGFLRYPAPDPLVYREQGQILLTRT
jgi:hypothetical protein